MNVYCIGFYKDKDRQWYEILQQNKIKSYMIEKGLTNKNIMSVWLTKRIIVNDFLEYENLKNE